MNFHSTLSQPHLFALLTAAASAVGRRRSAGRVIKGGGTQAMLASMNPCSLDTFSYLVHLANASAKGSAVSKALPAFTS